MSTDRRHGIGVIALGTIGQRLLGNVASHDGFAIAAGWDPDPAAMARATSACPEMRSASDAADVIGDPAVDVVYIGCPPAWHRQYVEQAVAAGKPIWCEKPLAIDLAEAEAMTALVERAGLPAAVNFVHAASGAIDATASALAQPDFGRPLRADLRIQFSRWPRDWQAGADWLRFRDQGGFVREVVSHFVYLSLRLFGAVELIDAIVAYPEDQALCESQILAQLDCAGVPLSIAAASGGAGPDQVEYTIWGARRSLRLVDWFNLHASDGGPWTPALPELRDPRGEAMQHQLDNIAALLAGRSQSAASFRDALEVQAVIEEMLRAG